MTGILEGAEPGCSSALRYPRASRAPYGVAVSLGVMTRTPKLILCLVATSFLLAVGCGSKVSSSSIEEQISSALEGQVGTAPDSVSCPDDLDAEVGATARCELSFEGETYGVSVEVTSVEGDVAAFDIEVDEEPS